MNLTNIIQLYALITDTEDNKLQVLSSKQLRDLNWKPEVIKQKPKVSVEKFLEKNLKGFMRFMIEYAE